MTERQKAVQVFNSATIAVHPGQLLQKHLAVTKDSVIVCGQNFTTASFNHIYIIGAGKAAAAMAVEAEKILGDHISDGLVVTKYHHNMPTQKIRVIEAAHPVPDQNCVKAMNLTFELLNRVTKEDLVICLISGGASALWCDVPSGLSLNELQTTFDLLIRSGAAIDEINIVRKHLSNIKGGQLVGHCNGAKVFSLIISDVPSDDPNVIACGPTAPDPSFFGDAFKVLAKYDLTEHLPDNILKYLQNGATGLLAETPKPDDRLFANTVNKIIGNNRMAVEAAAETAKALGYHVSIVPSVVTGDTETEAKELVRTALAYDGKKPACILQGGETTVKVTGEGKGGRNQHFVLAALDQLKKLDKTGTIIILSGGTDGTDGPTDATGAIADHETLQQADKNHLSIEKYLKAHDAYHFFEQAQGLLITGPTQTNVMDIMMAIIV